MNLKPPPYLANNKKWTELSLWQQFCYRYIYSFYGTEFHWYKPYKKFCCIDCGSKIPWRNFLKVREWRYNCCPSCEGFVSTMVLGYDYRDRECCGECPDKKHHLFICPLHPEPWRD